MKRLILLACATVIAGCSGARLSHDEARKKIAEIGTSSLVPGSIQIQRIVSQNDKDAIAETTISLAFEFKRDKPSDPWKVAAVRLGDRNWVGVDEIIASVNENRKRVTMDSLQKLSIGIASFRQKNGSAPAATDITGLTDILHPTYMTDLVRTDAWNRPIYYERSGNTFRLLSYGADGIRGTADDVTLQAP
ncbi:MAG TPA: type II secretion system protein GspG [Terriglobia bacterium]|nr:type II secretion system protein GspG [Terriglobia bacterium]